MSHLELEQRLRWLMTLRVVTVTTLLICAFGIELLLRPTESLRPLFLVAALAYGTVLLYAVLDRWLRGARSFVLVQLLGDALVITFFVQITGGLDSPMSFLYLLPVSVASILLYRRGGFSLAGACWALYGLLAVLGDSWAPFGTLVSVPQQVDTGRALYLLVAHLVAMLGFAILSSYLSERLRSQGQELAERQHIVARLKALNENIIESINSGLVTTDLDGKINFMNRGGAEILGHGHRDVEGRPAVELFNLGDGFLLEIRKQLLEKRRFRFERYFETKTGRRIFLGIAASNLHDKAGSPLGFIFIFQDLTEIHALEQEVRLKERMAALGEVAAGMAHELRNPLAAISGSVQYLRGELDAQGETADLMDIILRESTRLDRAIRDFLTFARPGNFAPEHVELIGLIEDQIKLLRTSQGLNSRHTIETHFTTPTLNCELDPNRIKQVFWNLTNNALKAMPDGGRLTLGVDCDNETQQIAIRFVDEGVGMNDEQQERYFQPFSGSFDEGTGLGAAIVYRLVEEHSGRIQLESAEGGGTCITIVLPVAQATPTAGAGQDGPLRAAGGACG